MDFGVVLIVAIVSVAIGYFAGLMLTNLNRDRTDHVTESEPIEASEPGPRFEADRLTMVLWSKTPDGPLFADINGKPIVSPTDLSVPERFKVDKALNDFQMWLGRPILRSGKTGELPTMQNNEVIPQTDQTSQEVSLGASAAADEPSDVMPADGKDIQSPITSVTTQEIEAELPAETISQVTPVPATISLRSAPKPPAPAPKSIVGQINDILQEKVSNSPLAETGIKLQETPKGVIVWVGKQSYQGVDTLPEGDAKKIIRAAVAEWEKK